MDVIQSIKFSKIKIKFLLVFFCLSIISCQNKERPSSIKVNYVNETAVSISFQSNYEIKDLSVHVKGVEIEILGEFEYRGKELYFVPVVPFTNGKSYQLRFKQGTIEEFSIKSKANVKKPRVLAIFPSVDTVPENLLKMYIQFSKPMQQVGNALDFVHLYDKNDNKLEDVFLPLENELWNEDQTILTLWLDPGRIKKELIPNKEKGLSLKQGETYKIVIDNSWRDADGMKLFKGVEKQIFVADRDEQKPDVNLWKVIPPASNSNDVLSIEFNEPLDAILLTETFQLLNDKIKIVEGRFNKAHNEKALVFIPEKKWKKGRYQLKINSELEDLAGNNLNRLFDVDLQNNFKQENEKFKSIKFEIE